jgi:glycosyltransferase involved in cell wall biosynthesis
MVMTSLTNKRYVVVSYWGYPFGGGEEFLLQSMSWGLEWGMQVCWLCFTNAQNIPYAKFSVKPVKKFGKTGYIVRVPGGFTVAKLRHWLLLLGPDIIHHQGHKRLECLTAAQDLRCCFITGYHFWHGAIQLDLVSQNHQILANVARHKPDPELKEIMDSDRCTPYAASEFMQEVISKVSDLSIPHVCYPSSDRSKRCDYINVLTNTFVTQVNVHVNKGGDIFLQLVKELSDVPFQCVFTEFMSEDLDKKIRTALESRERSAPGLALTHQPDIKTVFQKTKILLIPSLVDETFCRVALEGMMNGLPIITTGTGYIKRLVGDAGVVLSPRTPNEWIRTVRELYYNETKLRELSRRSLKQAARYTEEISKIQFRDIVQSAYLHSPLRNIMIFAPWGDQGLGIQAKNYYRLLTESNCRVFIFSFLPYFATDPQDRFQANPEEWKCNAVYYSNHIREHVTDEEILTFIRRYHIGTCIVPETCYHRVFEVAELLKRNHVRTLAIPNIEIVRRDEVESHRVFDKILCNNRWCEQKFQERGFLNTEYVSYAPFPMQLKASVDSQSSPRDPTSPLKFLLVGGMNAIVRKQADRVCEAFELCTSNVHLTLTTQKPETKLDPYSAHPKITLITRHMDHQEILGLYDVHDVIILVSKHEGLGLGFFEAISRGKPVITLNTPPHNEIIINGKNGWLVPCTSEPMKDNNQGLFGSAVFDPIVLAHTVDSLTWDTVYAMSYNTRQDYLIRFDANAFQNRFMTALEIKNINFLGQ